MSDEVKDQESVASEPGEGTHPSPAAEELELLREELSKARAERDALQAQVAEAQDKFLRARAELETYRRRAQQDSERAREAGLDSAVLPVLSVYDDLSRALMMADEDEPEKILPGIRSVLSGLERNLDALGIRRIGQVGESFSPDLHEALTASPAPSPEQEGTIAEVFEAGFVRGERLIRPARVVVYQ